MSVLETAVCLAIQQLGPLATVAAVRELVSLQHPADMATIDTILLKRLLLQQQLPLIIPVPRRKRVSRKRVSRKRVAKRSKKRSKKKRTRVPKRV